jgi:mannose-6-phosphate isomerase-like protein (cupin superfamily)
MTVHNLNEMFSQLVPDPRSDIQTRRVVDGPPSLILAELKPEKKLGAHYHTVGSEIYHVLEGVGVMEIGELADGGVHWAAPINLKAGDVLEVPARAVHRLSNPGSKPLRLVFFAPPNHLNDEDRFFV